MSSSSGCLLEPATGFAGSLMTIASSRGLDCASASVSQVSRVYCSNSPLDDVQFYHLGWAWRRLHDLPCSCMLCSLVPCRAMDSVFNRHLANGSMTSEMHSGVRPAHFLSQWRTFISSSVPSFHLGHAVGALNHIQPSLLFGILY